jgi:hypothetical protein
MQFSSAARSQIAAAAAFVVGPTIWAIASLLTDKLETWDSGGYQLVSLFAGCAIAIATYRWMEVVGGWAFGQFTWFATFERRLLDGNVANAIGVILATCLAPLIGALVGYAIRWVAEYVGRKRGSRGEHGGESR